MCNIYFLMFNFLTEVDANYQEDNKHPSNLFIGILAEF